MKLYISKIVLFFVPLVFSCILIEYFSRLIPNDYLNKRNYLDANSSKIELLFLGSSHSMYGLNPSWTKERSFNASHIAQSYELDLKILEKYADKWESLKYIVLPLSYQSLFVKLDKSKDAWLLKNYSLYYNIDTKKYLPYYLGTLNISFGNNVRRLYKYYLRNSNNSSCSELGWFFTDSLYSGERWLIQNGKESALSYSVSNFKYFPELSQNLESIIAFAASKKSTIILITPPAFESYRDYLDKAQLSKTIQTGNLLDIKYPNCYYFNLLDDKSFTKVDYYDADHLNVTGAKKLTFKIDSIIGFINSNKLTPQETK